MYSECLNSNPDEFSKIPFSLLQSVDFFPEVHPLKSHYA